VFTDDERTYLSDMEAITYDEHGQEVLVGLTREETEDYLELTRKLKNKSHDERGRYLELHDKHEMARLEALGAKHLTRH